MAAKMLFASLALASVSRLSVSGGDLDITGLMIGRGVVELSWQPPLNGVTIEKFDIHNQSGTEVFAQQGSFITRAVFPDQGPVSFYRIKWTAGSMALYMPHPSTPTSLRPYLPAQTNEASASLDPSYGFVVDLSGTNAFIPKGLITNDWGFLSRFEELECLEMWNYGIRDISFVRSMRKLKRLILSGNQIADISPLADLTDLELLYIDNNRISDISPLSNLRKIRHLGLIGNSISNLTPLASMTNMRSLHLGKNLIRDITPLEGMKQLEIVSLDQNPIQSLGSLGAKPDLFYLSAEHCLLTDLQPLLDTTRLRWVHLAGNAIRDLRPLESSTLSLLDVCSNQIRDVSSLLTIAKNGGFKLKRGVESRILLTGNPLFSEQTQSDLKTLAVKYGVVVEY